MSHRLWKVLRERRSAQVLLLIVCLAWPATHAWHWLRRPGEAQLLNQALRLADRGERLAAMGLIDEVLSRNPTSGIALLRRGQLARDAGDGAAAARFWARIPDHPSRTGGKARLLEGMLLLEEGRARAAEAALVKTIELSPETVEPHEALLKLYAVQLRAPDIQRELRALRRFREWNLNELYQLVNAAGEAVNRVDAIPRLERFIAADPDDALSLAALGQYHLWDDHPNEAVAVLRRAQVRSPNDASVRALLAEASMKRGDLAAARDGLRDTLPNRESPQCLWRSYGLFFAAGGNWRSGADCLRQAVALHPGDRPTLLQLALALEHAGDGDEANPLWERARWMVQLKAAMFRFVQAPANRSDVSLAALMQAGEMLMKLGRFEESAAFFEQVLAVNSGWPRARENRDEARRHEKLVPPDRHGAEPDDVLERAIAAAAGLAEVAPQTQPAAHDEPAPPPIRFVDRHHEARVDFQYANGARGLKYLLETTGGGVAVLDYDADGWPDLFFPQGGSIPLDPAGNTYRDGLFWNRGNGSFTDVSTGIGLDDNQYSQGCAAGDYDNDGFTDLAIANCGINVLYHNNGDGTFTDVTRGSGIAGKHWSTSLGWGDVDRDGNVDLYVVNYVIDHWQLCKNATGGVTLCHPQIFDAEPDALYVSRGDGTFEDALERAGMSSPNGRGLGVVIADLNDDGWPDVYVANDANPSFLFQNLGRPSDGRARFAEVGFPSGTAVNAAGNATAAMGIVCADVDGDGRLDLYVSNFHQEADILYLNRGNLIFEDAAERAGLVEATRPMLGWGAQAIDADLDGRPEIFVTNGHLDDRRDEGLPWKMPPQLFYNLGNGRFREISRECGEFFRGEYLGRGAARLDWNRDGLPDLVVVHHDRPVALLLNETERPGHRLVIELHGVESNRDAIGARLRVTAGGRTQVLEVCGGDGYCATNERRQVIGAGSADEISEIQITWPSGRVDRWSNLRADIVLTLIEGRPPVLLPLDPFRR
jgi:tetratricopeptide (TPR) repeat protein